MRGQALRFTMESRGAKPNVRRRGLPDIGHAFPLFRDWPVCLRSSDPWRRWPIFAAHCRSPLKREIFTLIGFLFLFDECLRVWRVSCGLFLQSGSEGSQLIRRVATFALDPERVADQVSLFRRRQMVEMKATFIVAVLCHPAEVELALSIGPAANGAFRANNYQEAATIRVDVASLAPDGPIAASVAPEGAARGVEGG